MTADIIPFTRLGDAICRETLVCPSCLSRAMRIVTNDAESGWAMECHNCGDLFEDWKIAWEPPGTP